MINVRSLPRELGRGFYGTIRLGFAAVGFGVRVARGAVEAVTGQSSERSSVVDGHAETVIERPPRRPRPARRAPVASAPPAPARAAPPPAPPPARAEPEPPAARSEPPAARPKPPPAPPEPPPEPPHVSEEPTLVAEIADPGAEEGAGAEVRVDEPWDGYAKLKAPEILERLPSASDEELAAIELYEATHRRRRTIIEAAERELRRRTASRR